MKTEPGLAAVKTELGLDDATALKWAREDWAQTELERQCRAFEQFAAWRRGTDEGGVVFLHDDSNDGAPPLVRQGDHGQGLSRGGRVKEENDNEDNGDGGDGGDFVALNTFFGL